jgi:hypothetical protein
LQGEVADSGVEFGQVQVAHPGVAERWKDVDVQAGPLFGQRRFGPRGTVPLDLVGHQVAGRHVSEAHMFSPCPPRSALGVVELGEQFLGRL